MRIGLMRVFLLAGGVLAESLPTNARAIEAEPCVPWVGAAGVQETTLDIMLRTISQPENGRETKVLKPRLAAERDGLPQDPQALDPSQSGFANVPLSPKAGTPDSPTIAGAQSRGISFTAATLVDASGFPPDSMGAAGPSQFLTTINGRVRTINKLTGVRDGVLDTTTDAFFSSVMTPPVSNNFTSDPRVRYDRLSGRWFITIIDVPGTLGSLPNRVLIAVSDSGTITSSTIWTFFFFQHDLVSPTGDSNLFADYPTLGIDAHALYIGVNIFGKRGNPTAFSNTTVFVVRKSSLLSGGPIVATAFRSLIRKVQGINTGLYTPQGVDNYDPTAPEGYVIGVDASFMGRLDLRRITNPEGTPSISANLSITTASSSNPINVPHLGNTGGASGYLDGLDNRLLAAHVRGGRLWTSQNIGVNNAGSTAGTITRNAIRWYELQGIATGQTPSVVQSGTLFEPSASNTTDQRHYWMGTIMVSGQGHAAMGFSAAGANEFINAGFAGRLANDPLGTLQSPVLYTSSSTAYNPPGDPGGTGGRRWGDYSYTCLDPNDDMTMWTIQEYCNAVNSYAVQVSQILAPLPASPLSCDPSSVAAGTSSADIVITGTSVNGSGFFDPGAGFPNHLSAVVNGGGVAINRAAYTDPTHLTLNVSVAAGAVSGSRTITVTNPDGQSATSSSAILAIVGGGASNRPPVLSAISDQAVDEQSPLTFTSSATDPDGDPLTFILGPGSPPGASVDPATGVFTWTPTEAQGPGTYLITIEVSDNGTPPLGDTRSFTVLVNEVNRAPTLTVPADRTVNTMTTLLLTNTAADPDLPANSLTYSLVSAPAGVSLDPITGRLTWTPTIAQGPSTNLITVKVTDNGNPPASDTMSFSVVVTAANRAPTLTVPADQIIDEMTTLTVTNTASDPDLPADSLTFSLVSAPAGMRLDPTSGVVSWTPAEDQGPGTNLIVVQVSDNGSPPLSDARSFTVVVNEVNTPPLLTPVPDQITLPGGTVTVTGTARDVDIPANAIAFSLDSGAPAGATVDPVSGFFSWTAPIDSLPGTNVVTLRATDNGVPSLSDATIFRIIVVSPPVIESIVGSTGAVALNWSALEGWTYRVQYKSDLTETTWNDLLGDVVATGPVATKTDTAISTPQRYYRIVLLTRP